MIVIHFTSALKTKAYKNDLYSRRKSLLKTVEVACSSLGAVHRPFSGKQILEMSRFEVFAEGEFSVSLQRIAERTYCCVHVFLDTSPLSDQWSRLRLSFLDVSSQFQASMDSLLLSRGLFRACR